MSILTPSRNYARFIEDAILSVSKQQTSLNVEHIVVDAESTDSTTQILSRFPEVDWISESDSGQSEALNKAFSRSSGSWIGWLNSDEFYMPGALDCIEKAMEEHPEVDIFYGDALFVGEDGRFIRFVPQHPFSRRVLRNYGCYISSCTTFIRRDLFELKRWDESLDRIMDWDLWLDFERQGARFRHLPAPLGAFRVHSARVTSRITKPYSDQHLRVRRRHGMPLGRLSIRASSRLGALHHATLKALSGSYSRQLKARKLLAGRDLRWFMPNFPQEILRKAERI